MMRLNPGKPWGRATILAAVILCGACLAAGYFTFPWLRTRISRSARLVEWFRHPKEHTDWAIQAGQICRGAAFRLPTDGYIGFLWDDAFRLGHRHQGVDIFSGTPAGETAVVAAYAGYLTRLSDWKSSVIIRIPADPLQPGRQIWTYYTHMALADGKSTISEDFPAGTSEQYVPAGRFLGYQGNYSGDPLNPVGVHLHFSIVLDQNGKFRNELEFRNTIDPSPYFGLALNARKAKEPIPTCLEAP